MVTAKLKDPAKVLGMLKRMTEPLWFEGPKRALAEAALGEVMRSFDTQTDPWGRPWKRSIRAELEGGETLSDTGRLRRSITYRVLPGGFALGTNVKYAATHQFGAVIEPKNVRNKEGKPYLRFRIGSRRKKRGRWVTKKTPVRIPARPFISYPGLSDRWMRAFEDALEAYFRDG